MLGDKVPRIKIVAYPAAILDRKMQPVAFPVSDELLGKIIEAGLWLAEDPGAAGVAAPQLNIDARFFLVKVMPERRVILVVNPEIIYRKDFHTNREGCLSLPGKLFTVRRPGIIKVKYQDIDGASHTLKAHDRLAACIDHENDHLDGFTVVDRERGIVSPRRSA